MILIEGHVQYITFTFFRQVRVSGALIFQDKINFAIAIFAMFIVLIYTISSFVLFSWYLTKKKVAILFPFTTPNFLINMLLVFFMGPGRNLLLGVFQSFYEDFALQMCLLIGLNMITLFILSFFLK